jgi:hypothetical protein
MLYLAPLAALLFFAGTARAAPPRKPHFVTLEYVRGPGAEKGCPSEAMMRHAILARLDDDPFSDTAKATLRVSIIRVGKVFQASYELCDEDGECVDGAPVPEHRLCINAVESVAFSVGIFMPGLLTESTPARKEPPPSPAPPPARNETPRPRSTKFARPFRMGLDVGGLGSLNITPGLVNFGFSAHAVARWPSFSLSLGFRYELYADHDLRFSRALGEAAPCLHFRNEQGHSLVGCGLLQLGSVSSVSKFHGLDLTASWGNMWAGLRGGGEFRFPRPFPPNLSVFLYVDVTCAVVRATVFTGETNPWTTPYVSEALGGSLVWLFL